MLVHNLSPLTSLTARGARRNKHAEEWSRYRDKMLHHLQYHEYVQGECKWLHANTHSFFNSFSDKFRVMKFTCRVNLHADAKSLHNTEYAAGKYHLRKSYILITLLTRNKYNELFQNCMYFDAQSSSYRVGLLYSSKTIIEEWLVSRFNDVLWEK